MNLSKNIRKLRKERGISQQIIASQLGVTRQAVAAYEKGIREPDVETILKLADFFDVSLDFIVGRIEIPERNVYEFSKNLKKIRSDRTFSDFSRDIGARTGLLVLPEVLENVETGKKLPHISAMKILASYAGVEIDDFFKRNIEIKLN